MFKRRLIISLFISSHLTALLEWLLINRLLRIIVSRKLTIVIQGETMKYLRLALCGLILLTASFAWAGRILPRDVQIVVLKNAEGQQVVLGTAKKAWLHTLSLGLINGNKTFQLSRAVRVHDANNRFITYNNLSRFKNSPIAVRFDRMNQILEIWVLTDEEQNELIRPNNPQVE